MLMQVSEPVQLPEQSMVPPQPFDAVVEQDFAGHAVEGVQH